MLNTPLVEKNMFNTLVFSKKMQNVGMSQEVAEELSSALLNIHINQFENLLTKKEFSIFESDIKKNIDEVKNEMENFITKKEFSRFENEIKKDIDEVKNEMENFVTKKEFYAETKNLSLNITIKMGIIMTTGIGALALLIKL